MSNKNLIERNDAKLLSINGFKTIKGEFKSYCVRDKENKAAKTLNLLGEETSMIYKKLVNEEWIEVSPGEFERDTATTPENYPHRPDMFNPLEFKVSQQKDFEILTALKPLETWNIPAGKFQVLVFVDMRTKKPVSGLNFKGESVFCIFKKLENDEWIEITELEMPKMAISLIKQNYPELLEITPECSVKFKHNELINSVEKKLDRILDVSVISEVAIDAGKEDLTNNFKSIFGNITGETLQIQDLLKEATL